MNEVMKALNTHSWPDVDDFGDDGPIFGVFIAIPMLTTAIYFSTLPTFNNIAGPHVVQEACPGFFCNRLVARFHYNFFSICKTSLEKLIDY